VANFTFLGAEMWEYSPQNRYNFEFCYLFADFYEISALVRVYKIAVMFKTYLHNGFLCF